MKKKNIALIVTAAISAGIVAAVGALGAKEDKKAAKTDTEKKPASAENSFSSVFGKNEGLLKEIAADTENIVKVCCDNENGDIILLYENKAVRLSDMTEAEIPENVISAAVNDEVSAFITENGCIFYIDDERKYCQINSPEYICSGSGKFYVFSDNLLYICGSDGEIEKTVSLCAMIDLKDNDVCDAENTDDSFSAAEVHIKKMYSFDPDKAAVITEDGRLYIMNTDEDGFIGFEKVSDNVCDICTSGGYAYYLSENENGTIIVRFDPYSEMIEEKLFGIRGKKPVKFCTDRVGLAVLSDENKIMFIQTEDCDMEKMSQRSSFMMKGKYRPENAFVLSDDLIVVIGGKYYKLG